MSVDGARRRRRRADRDRPRRGHLAPAGPRPRRPGPRAADHAAARRHRRRSTSEDRGTTVTLSLRLRRTPDVDADHPVSTAGATVHVDRDGAAARRPGQPARSTRSAPSRCGSGCSRPATAAPARVELDLGGVTLFSSAAVRVVLADRPHRPRRGLAAGRPRPRGRRDPARPRDQRPGRPGRPALSPRAGGRRPPAVWGTGPVHILRSVRLRRSDVNGPGYRRRRAGRGFAYYDDRRRADQGRPARPHPRRWRSRRRGRTSGSARGPTGTSRPPASTPPAGGSTATTTSGAPGATPRSTSGCWRSPASSPTSGTPSRPALRTRGLNRDRVLATAIRLLDLGAFRIGSEQYEEENGTYGLATLKRDARLGPRRADVLLLHRQGRHRAGGRDHRPADGHRRPAAARAARRRGGGPARLPDRRRRVARRDQRRDQRLPQGDQRRGDHRQGLPHLDRHRAHGRRARRGAAADEQDGAQEGRSAPPTSRSASSSATRPAVCKASYVDPRVVDRFENGETVGARAASRPRSAEADRDTQKVLEAGRLPAAVCA